MHNEVADMLEDGIAWTLKTHTDISATGSSYSGGNSSKGNRIMCMFDSNITTLRMRVSATSGRTYKARLFQEDGTSNLGTQVGATPSTTGTTTGSEVLVFTMTDWVVAAGNRYCILVFDDTGAALTAYYTADPDAYGGAPICWREFSSSVYADATPVASEAFTSDNDIYMMSLEGTTGTPVSAWFPSVELLQGLNSLYLVANYK
jgi:hypothetical protein